jgi:hypothetical protein
MSFKLPIHDPSHKGKDLNDATCQQVCSSGAHAQAQEPTAHISDTKVLGGDPPVSASRAVDVAMQEDLEDCKSDSDSDSNFVSSTDTSDTGSDTDSDEDEHSFDDFEDAGRSGLGEHEQE